MSIILRYIVWTGNRNFFLAYLVSTPFSISQVQKNEKLLLAIIFVIPEKLIHKQDKVNYAVSEREDRQTDLTTLTRMTGCSGIFWAILSCNGV